MTAPSGTCDTHVHVMGPYSRFPLIEDRAYTAPEAPVAMLRQHLDILGVDRVVVAHVTVCGEDPAVTVDAIKALGKRARGVLIPKPDISTHELKELNDQGICGIRLSHLSRQQHGIESMRELASKIAPFHWHVQFSPTSLSHWLEVAPLLESLPVDVVVDHMAWRTWNAKDGLDQEGFRTLVDLLDTGRIWVKIAAPERYSRVGAPSFSDVTPYAQALIQARPDRMLWGTDWPHVTAWNHPVPNDADLLDWILALEMDEAARHAMLVDNPAKLYGFS